MIHELAHEGKVPAAQLAAPGEALPEGNPLRGPTLFAHFTCKGVSIDVTRMEIDLMPCKGTWDVLRTASSVSHIGCMLRTMGRPSVVALKS